VKSLEPRIGTTSAPTPAATMARLFTRAALAVALLSAVPADAFFPGGAMVARRPALRHLSGVCPRRAAPAAARMSSAGDDRPGAAEQEAAIKAAKEAARMKTKSGGASSAGIKRLGTVRVPGQSVMRAMQPAGPNGRRIGTGVCRRARDAARACALLLCSCRSSDDLGAVPGQGAHASVTRSCAAPCCGSEGPGYHGAAK
jgi:hypothetical protein